MRLIDAEKFEVFDATCPIPKGMRCGKTAAYFYGEGCRKVLEAIDAAPTIDTETLRPTAQWVEAPDEGADGSWEACSRCAWESRWAASQYKYCPHCGARMVNADDPLDAAPKTPGGTP